MKTIFNIKSVLVAIIILTISTGFSHQGNEIRIYDDLVQVVANSAKGTARILVLGVCSTSFTKTAR